MTCLELEDGTFRKEAQIEKKEVESIYRPDDIMRALNHELSRQGMSSKELFDKADLDKSYSLSAAELC